MAMRGKSRLRALVFGICAGLAACLASSFAGPERASAAPRRVSAPLSLVHGRSRHAHGHSHHHASRSRHRRPIEPTRAAAPVKPAAPAGPPPGSHDGVVTIAADGAEGTDARVASDIQSALSSAGVRVMPVLATNSLATLHDLPHSPVVDLALARADALDAAKSQDPSADKEIGYVARLFDEEICVLARRGVTDIRQLDGKKVGIDVAGSSDWVTGRNVFGKLRLHPQFVEEDAATALAALDKGQLDAVVLVDGKPAPILFSPRAAGVHVLAIPYDAALQEQYYPAQLTHADYPQLVQGAPVDTIAVATLLVAPMAADTPTRDQRIANFAQAFLNHFDAFLALGKHPKWRDVNLAADAPGWSRVPSAKQWLETAETEEERRFNAYVASRARPMPTTPAEKDKLFQEFVKWNRTRAP